MSLISWAVDTAYVKRAEHLLRKEHDEWVRQAAKQLPGTYWTLAPEIAATDNAIPDAYDIHGQYTFARYSLVHPTQLVSTLGTSSWTIWHRYGPMTSRPQQTYASYHAANASGQAAELRRMDAAFKAANNQALAELANRYPHSVRALVNA